MLSCLFQHNTFFRFLYSWAADSPISSKFFLQKGHLTAHVGCILSVNDVPYCFFCHMIGKGKFPVIAAIEVLINGIVPQGLQQGVWFADVDVSAAILQYQPFVGFDPDGFSKFSLIAL